MASANLQCKMPEDSVGHAVPPAYTTAASLTSGVFAAAVEVSSEEVSIPGQSAAPADSTVP